MSEIRSVQAKLCNDLVEAVNLLCALADALQSRSANDSIFQVVEALSEAPINQRRATAPSNPGG